MPEGAYHHGNLRSALLERAEAVLAESGTAGLSLRGLARDLGVSHAAPTRHFRDRQAVLDALVVGGFTALNGRLQAAADGPGPVGQRLTALGRAYVGFAVERAALLQLMFTAKHEAQPGHELRELGHRALEIAAGLIAEAQQDGTVRPGDPIRLAQVAFSTVHGLATLAVGGLLDDTPVSEATDLALNVLLTGLRPTP
ncbi:TetR/AcrR family transcriptional regulator [Streptomyces antimicrobicus]|uniref:TetR/AcrR family transcriptional regulator n=1 Tax=Streptomyces antimicrobicus TaxID=2883108 RepID=A0ABS8B2I5_9ACTN|nr:TetR/AcrR family transcriptional regulator [Streptomyces antimicrobicus]MCB5178787.1 TetR/AcrR family transcriptional regulator [Streptomyces antimicrobicus]